jgi:hypothetical protein
MTKTYGYAPSVPKTRRRQADPTQLLSHLESHLECRALLPRQSLKILLAGCSAFRHQLRCLLHHHRRLQSLVPIEAMWQQELTPPQCPSIDAQATSMEMGGSMSRTYSWYSERTVQTHAMHRF